MVNGRSPNGLRPSMKDAETAANAPRIRFKRTLPLG